MVVFDNSQCQRSASRAIPTKKLKTHKTEGGPDKASSTTEYLKVMYLIGRLSGPDFQEGSAASMASSASDNFYKNISTTGASGEHKGSIHRDIIRHLNKTTDGPAV